MHLAQTAYATPATPVRSAKDTEYQAFVAMTGALKRASTPTDKATALHRNRELWTILASDVADPDNTLPAALRARIFYLSEFTSQHTSKVLAGKDSIDILIDINTAMMRGLRPRSEAA